MKPHRRWMRLGTATLLLIAASSGTSCGRPDMAERRVPNATAGHGPVLQLADTIILEESDSLFLGKPGYTFAVDEQGMMYVPDLFVDHVIQYTAAGKAARVYGKHGRGPGELSRLGATFVLDSFLIQDIGRALVVFDRRTGKFLYNRPYRGNVAGLALVSGRIWLGNFDPTSQRGLAGREATEFFRDSSGAAYEPLMSTKVP